MAIGTPVDLGHNASAATPASLVITTLAAVNAGDCIVLFHYGNATTGPISGIIDDAGNAGWVLAWSFTTTAPLMECWICPNAKALTLGQTITANFSGSILRHGISAFTVSGVKAVSPVDAISATASATSTTDGTVGTGTLAQANELVVGCVVAGGALGTITQGTGFTSVGGSLATAIVAPAYALVTNRASINYSPSWVNSVLTRIRVMSLIGEIQAGVPILDEISGAVAGYSLRKLRAAYAGKAVNIRRDSDNTTQDIGFNGSDFDTASFNSFVGSGNGFVAKWYDQVGSADVSQTTAANQPQLITSGTSNGRPAVKNTSANNVILTGTITASTVPSTFVAYMSRTGNQTQYNIPFSLGSPNPGLFYDTHTDGGIGIADLNADVVLGTGVDNTFHSAVGIMGTHLGNDSSVYVDGTGPTTGSLVANTGSTSIQLFNYDAANAGQGFVGTLAEAIYFNGRMNASDVASFNTDHIGYYVTAIPNPPPVVSATVVIGAAGKKRQVRKWRLRLPDGRVVVADTANEYYQQLTRIVRADQKAKVEAQEAVTERQEREEVDSHASRPQSTSSLRPKPFKLTPIEKREAVEWAAEMPTIDLREIADRVWAMRKELHDINDDEDVAIVLRWVI